MYYSQVALIMNYAARITVYNITFFMARRAIPMIAFPRVRTIYIYIYIYIQPSTYASMRCIRS